MTVYTRFSGGITVDYRELQLVERTSQKHFYQLGEKEELNSNEKHKREKAYAHSLLEDAERSVLCPHHPTMLLFSALLHLPIPLPLLNVNSL